MITLKTLSEATAQEVFDQVAKHLLTQGVASRHLSRGVSPTLPMGICMYKNQDGLKCAAGCLIADDEYNEEIENATWGTLVNSEVAPKAHSLLIGRLQRIHDINDPSIWKEELEKVADKHGLSTACLNEFNT